MSSITIPANIQTNIPNGIDIRINSPVDLSNRDINNIIQASLEKLRRGESVSDSDLKARYQSLNKQGCSFTVSSRDFTFVFPQQRIALLPGYFSY